MDQEGTMVPQGGAMPNPDRGGRSMFEGMNGGAGGSTGGGRGAGLAGTDGGMVHVAQMVAPEDAARAEANRDMDADYDAGLEAMSGFGLTRAVKDANRATSRDGSRVPSHPAKDKQLPVMDAVRTPMAVRQQRVRSAAKNRAMARWSQRERAAVFAMVGHARDDKNSLWSRLNAGLESNHGSLVGLADKDPALARRARELDRAIRLGENESGRTHVIYTNIVMPPGVPTGDKELTEWTRQQMPPGHSVALDGYTIGAHNMHEVCDPNGESHPSVVFEIRTRRGLYLGQSEGADNTAHLLARGHRGRVTGVQEVRYQRPDGTRGTRTVVQIEDLRLVAEANAQAGGQ